MIIAAIFIVLFLFFFAIFYVSCLMSHHADDRARCMDRFDPPCLTDCANHNDQFLS